MVKPMPAMVEPVRGESETTRPKMKTQHVILRQAQCPVSRDVRSWATGLAGL